MGWITVDLAKISGPMPGIFGMSRECYSPMGILLAPPGASLHPVMSKWHYGDVHENITSFKTELRMLYLDVRAPLSEMKRINA